MWVQNGEGGVTNKIAVGWHVSFDLLYFEFFFLVFGVRISTLHILFIVLINSRILKLLVGIKRNHFYGVENNGTTDLSCMLIPGISSVTWQYRNSCLLILDGKKRFIHFHFSLLKFTIQNIVHFAHTDIQHGLLKE